MDKITQALNLWDIEESIIVKQKELEALHEMKDSILYGKDLFKGNQIVCD